LISQSAYQLAQSSSAPSTIPEDAMVSLACLVQQSADLLQGSYHLILHNCKSRDHQATDV
jgi:hypothetical protein